MNEKHWNDEVFSLHEKSKLSPLSPWEREAYALARAEVTRGLLAAQELMRPETQRARTSLRIRHHVPVTLSFGGREISTMTANVSSGGCAVLLDQVPEVEEVSFSLRFECDFGMRGVARIVAVVNTQDGVLVCLRFLGLNDLDREMLDEVIIDLVFDHLQADRERRILALLAGGDAFSETFGMKKVS